VSRARILRAFVVARWLRRFRTRAALERFQARRVRRQLRFLRAHSPWFRESPCDLAALPLMVISVLMSYLVELISIFLYGV
jgi:hypothetical protein